MSTNHRLKLIGLMLYAGEGAKTGNTVDFINTNPILVAAFTAFLRDCCQIDENRLKFYLYCFEDQSVNELIQFWCDRLNVSPQQFTKPYIRKVFNKRNRISAYGVIHVRYSSKELLQRILREINNTLKRFG